MRTESSRRQPSIHTQQPGNMTYMITHTEIAKLLTTRLIQAKYDVQPHYLCLIICGQSLKTLNLHSLPFSLFLPLLLSLSHSHQLVCGCVAHHFKSTHSFLSFVCLWGWHVPPDIMMTRCLVFLSRASEENQCLQAQLL